MVESGLVTKAAVSNKFEVPDHLGGLVFRFIPCGRPTSSGSEIPCGRSSLQQPAGRSLVRWSGSRLARHADREAYVSSPPYPFQQGSHSLLRRLAAHAPAYDKKRKKTQILTSAKNSSVLLLTLQEILQMLRQDLQTLRSRLISCSTATRVKFDNASRSRHREGGHTHHAAWHTLHNIIYGAANKMDDYLERLAKLDRCPVTVLHGTDDEVLPLDCSYAFKSKVPTAQLKVIENKDHLTIVIGRQKTFARELGRRGKGKGDGERGKGKGEGDGERGGRREGEGGKEKGKGRETGKGEGDGKGKVGRRRGSRRGMAVGGPTGLPPGRPLRPGPGPGALSGRLVGPGPGPGPDFLGPNPARPDAHP
ncbi:hypothetical protein EJ110_NYTH14589 [Nymphaea thermarum]|nr:hypothetical protein EJ110_NYTH14589 [Nymphaea thermarum]